MAKENTNNKAAQTPKVSHSEARTANAVTARTSRRWNRGASEAADWGTADPLLVLAAITSVGLQGCAIRFGYTRDGGAFAIGIVGDGEPYTEYVRPTEDINEYLRTLSMDFSDESEGT
jgi:hypothetical protein